MQVEHSLRTSHSLKAKAVGHQSNEGQLNCKHLRPEEAEEEIARKCTMKRSSRCSQPGHASATSFMLRPASCLANVQNSTVSYDT